MKICSNCGASNADAAKFCGECGAAMAPLGAPSVDVPKQPVSAAQAQSRVTAADLARSLAGRAAGLEGQRKADIMFVLDCTGSMQGEIDAMKDAIISFAQTIESDGVRARVGLIEFRDRLINQEHRVLNFAGQVFTSDAGAFRGQVSLLKASGGGGNDGESSPDAVMLALQQPFAADANKVIVLVTDEPPHFPDKETRSIEQLCQAVKDGGIHQLYLVMRTQDPKSQVLLKLLESTGARGMAFELGTGDDFRRRAEHFKKTLMALGKTISQGTT